MNGNSLFYGVVESRNDPLKLGRCKVRVVGVHTEDSNLLPTKDLPWAYPMMPINSAAMSGIGSSPMGPVEGTWIVIMFRDEGSFQEPLMLGTVGGIPEKDSSLVDSEKNTAGTKYDAINDVSYPEQSDQQGYAVDSDGNKITDSQGNPIRTGGDQILQQTDTKTKPVSERVDDAVLGKVSEKYETGGKGVGAINDYNGKASGDFGGASYGKWQLASYRDKNGSKPGAPNKALSPVVLFVNQSKYKDEFAGLTPATTAFDLKWREVAAKDPNGFESEQRDFIAGKYYSKSLNSLRSDGIDVSNKGSAVQDALWSTSVQYGPGKAATIFKRALKGRDPKLLTDAEIVAAVQDDKAANVPIDFKSSPSLWDSLSNRIASEKKDLVKLAGTNSEFSKEDIERINSSNSQTQTTDKTPVVIPASGVSRPITVSTNSKPGFQDPSGVYPKDSWNGEPDVSRLARNEKINETILLSKQRTLVKDVGIAGSSETWDEPESKYDAIYPLNHVKQTESGHVEEFDDTPGAERIHIYHRTGSFVEFHPDGTVVVKSTKKRYSVIVSDENVFIGGNMNITVTGDANIFSSGVVNFESDGDMNIKCGANLRIGAEGNIFMEANKDTHVGAGSNLHESGKNIFMNCAWAPKNISAGDYEVGIISVSVFDDGFVVIPQSKDDSVKADFAKTNPTYKPHADATAPREFTVEKRTEAKTELPNLSDEDINPSTMISKNYALADVSTSAVFSRYAVKDQASLTKKEIVQNLSELANAVLEPLRATYGNQFYVTSGFRNYTSGKVSQHCKGEAVDIQFNSLSREEAVHRAQEISKMLPSYDQMILEYHGNNPVIHISYSSERNRKQKLSTADLSNYHQGFSDKNMNRVYS